MASKRDRAPTTSNVDVLVSFTAPASAGGAGPGSPLLNLMPMIATGGTLKGGEVLYYAVSGVDSAGNEGPLSFIVQAVIPADQSAVTISGLSFAPNTSTFNVYRSSSPAELLQIAAAQTMADHFTDSGLADGVGGAARREFRPRQFLLAAGTTTGNSSDHAFSPTRWVTERCRWTANSYRGMARTDHAGCRRRAGASDCGERCYEPYAIVSVGGRAGFEQFFCDCGSRLALRRTGREQSRAVRGSQSAGRGSADYGSCIECERCGIDTRAGNGDAMANRRIEQRRYGCSGYAPSSA